MQTGSALQTYSRTQKIRDRNTALFERLSEYTCDAGWILLLSGPGCRLPLVDHEPDSSADVHRSSTLATFIAVADR